MKTQTEHSHLLKDQLPAAMSVKVEGQTAEITVDDCERMAALGYIDGDCNEIAGGPVSTGASPEAQ